MPRIKKQHRLKCFHMHFTAVLKYMQTKAPTRTWTTFTCCLFSVITHYLQTCCSLSTFCLLAWTSLCQTAGSTPSGMCCSSSNSSIARSKLRTASEFAREDEGLGPNGLPLSGRPPCDSVAALSCFCPLRKKIPFWNHSFITTYKLPDCYLSWLSWLFQVSKVAGSTAFHTI